MTLVAFILWQALSLFRPTVSPLMESVPAELNIRELVIYLSAIEGVIDLHHVHVREPDEEHRAQEGHVTNAKADMNQIKRAIRQWLCQQYSIEHCTLKFELNDEACTYPAHNGHDDPADNRQ